MSHFLISFFIFIFLTLADDGSSNVNTWTGPYNTSLHIIHGTITSINSSSILIFGGLDSSGTPQSALYSLTDINTTSPHITQLTQTGTTFPSARYYHSAAQITDGTSGLTLVVFGGKMSDNQTYADAYRLNLTSYSWESFLTNTTQIPSRYRHAMATTDSGTYLVIYGGASADGAEMLLTDVWVWRNSTNTWVQATYSNSSADTPPSLGCKLAFYESNSTTSTWILSGGESEDTSDAVHLWKLELTENDDSITAQWATLAYRPSALPNHRDHHMHIDGSTLYLWGGSATSTDFDVINIPQRSWTPIHPSTATGTSTLTQPPLLSGFASTYLPTHNFVIVLGGEEQDSTTELDSLWLYTPDHCNQYGSCGECTEASSDTTGYPYSCVWCSSKGRCIAGQTDSADATQMNPYGESCEVKITAKDNCQQGETETEGASCSSYTTCEECTQWSRCGWCQTMESYPEQTYGCFEGTDLQPYLGQCTSYVADAEYCSEVAYELDILSPVESAEVCAGTIVYFVWTTSGLSSAESESVTYTLTSVYNETETTVATDLPSAGFYAMSTLISWVGDVTFCFSAVSGDSVINVKNISVTFIKPTSNFFTPSSGEIITEAQYLITWNTTYAASMPLVTMALSDANTSAIVGAVFALERNNGSFLWTLGEDYNETTNYSLNLYWHYNTMDVYLLCTSDPFLINITDPYYKIYLSTGNATLVPGETVTINWSSNRPQYYSNIFLMDGSDHETAVSREVIALYQQNATSVDWVVNVNTTSSNYFFRVENEARTLYSDTDTVAIPASQIEVNITVPETASEDRNPGLDISTSTAYYENTVQINWNYTGGISRFRIDLRYSNGTIKQLLPLTPSNLRTFQLTLNSTFTHNTIFSAIITAVDFGDGISGISNSIRVVEPGSIAYKSTIGIALTVVFGVLSVAYALLFYWFVFRKHKLGGFQRI